MDFNRIFRILLDILKGYGYNRDPSANQPNLGQLVQQRSNSGHDEGNNMSQPDRTLQTESFSAVGMHYYSENIGKLACRNEDWKRTAKNIISLGKTDKRIYRYNYIYKPVKLIPEPTNQHDKNAIIVQIAGEKVGYISRDENLHVKDILNNCEVKYISAFIGGGDYKIVQSNGEMIKQSEPHSITIKIGYIAPNSSSKGTTSGNESNKSAEPTESAEPFYKKMWFLVVCGLLFPPAGIALVWLLHKDWDIRKKGIATGIMAVWFIIIMCSGGNETPETVSNSDAPSVVASSSDTAGEKLSFTLKGCETGEYGEWLTLSADTDTPDTFIAYHIPVGDHKATNLDPEYPLFIYVYSDATEIIDGWEYQVDCLQTVELGVGQSAVFSVPEGYYIQLIGSDNGTAVLIEQQ